MTPLATSLDDLDAAQHVFYALQLSLGIVFALSALPKLRHPSQFADTVVEYGIVSPRIARSIAPVVAAVECFLAVAFLTGALIELALVVAAVILFAFAAVTATNLRRGRDVPCGCFGNTGERISVRSLVRIALLLSAVGLLSAALILGWASATTVSELMSDGSSGLSYIIEVAGFATALTLMAALLLSLPALGPLLRYLRPTHSTLPEEGRSPSS